MASGGPVAEDVELLAAGDIEQPAAAATERRWGRWAAFSGAALVLGIVALGGLSAAAAKKSPQTPSLGHKAGAQEATTPKGVVQLWGESHEFSCGGQLCDCAWAQNPSSCNAGAYDTTCGSCCCNAYYGQGQGESYYAAAGYGGGQDNTKWIVLGAIVLSLIGLAAYYYWSKQGR